MLLVVSPQPLDGDRMQRANAADSTSVIALTEMLGMMQAMCSLMTTTPLQAACALQRTSMAPADTQYTLQLQV